MVEEQRGKGPVVRRDTALRSVAVHKKAEEGVLWDDAGDVGRGYRPCKKFSL